MQTFIGALLALSLAAAPSFRENLQTRETAKPVDLMPMPSVAQPADGQLVVSQSFTVGLTGYVEPRLDRAAQRFVHDLSRQTGIPIVNGISPDASSATVVVKTDHPSKPVQDVDEDESYSLDVTPTQATLHAANPLGALHGFETFLQLVRVTPAGFAAGAIHIEDRPRFPWRGLMFDVGRHFIPVNVLERNIDGMAAVKLNVFHWHLSENQGFRVETKSYPKLHEMGSDGLYYTREEIREVIEYAHERGIRVVPEFDMPGHATAWFVGYPELASGAGPYKIEREWGVFDPAMDPTRESTYKFLQKLLGELTALFPDQYFHIGGDEVNGKEWDANPKIQEFMHARGIKNDHDLQQYFNSRVQKIVTDHHKIMVGWDEVIAPGFPPDTVIQSWRGQNSLAEAIKLGYHGILSYGYYLDMMSPASQHYRVDPMAENTAQLNDQEKSRIFGGEACMWSEYITAENIDSRIWPRTAVIAERLWSPQPTIDVNSMYDRLTAESIRLESIGLTHRASENQMLRRLAGTDDIAALRVLADVVEPVKEYDRENIGMPGSITSPLNRLIDAIPPESDTARRFAEKVDALVASKFQNAGLEKQIRSQLAVWSGNDAQLEPLYSTSYIVKEIEPVSQNLSTLGQTGLEALDYIDQGQPPSADWLVQQAQAIKQAEGKKADLLLMIVPSIEKLVNASAAAAKREN
jgi:hexosaminidase